MTRMPSAVGMMSAQTGVVRDGALMQSGSDQDHRFAVDEGTMVVVQREWNGWRTASARLSDLQSIHWLQPNGAPRPLIHAYIPCTKLQTGEIPHDCDVKSVPHRLLVCVLKCHTAPVVFAVLSHLASERGLEVRARPLAAELRT